MKNFLIIIFLSFFVFDNLLANQEVINSLKIGGKLVFIRHAIAPGGGDPDHFVIKDCSTQRNLNSAGIAQAKRIGEFFKDNNISINQVLSSEWCRCKDTAQFAFNEYTTFDALNSFYDSRFEKNKDKQIRDLKNYILNWNSKKNLVLVTHFVVISEIFNIGASSGEIIISDKKFNIIGRYKIGPS